MTKYNVVLLKTRPERVRSDYHELMNLAGYRDVIAKDADTGLKINIGELPLRHLGDAEQRLKVLGTCITEAPEVAARRRRNGHDRATCPHAGKKYRLILSSSCS